MATTVFSKPLSDQIANMQVREKVTLTTVTNSRIENWNGYNVYICGSFILINISFNTKGTTSQSSGYEKIAELDLSDYIASDEEIINDGWNINVNGSTSNQTTGNSYVFSYGMWASNNNKLSVSIFQYGSASSYQVVRTVIMLPFKKKKTS